MSAETDEDNQRRALDAALSRTDLTLEQLWSRYFALGGDAGLVELEAFLSGLMPLTPLQRDILAQAVNERLDELAGARVPYTRVVSEAKPDHGPLAALLEVLEGTRLAPPERLIEAVGAAGRALGVHIIVYLVDYDQRRLVPLVEPGLPDLPSLEVDATLAGRAFRLVEPLSANVDGQQRLWLPLLDGAERLGVLDVRLPEEYDVRDIGLWQQCEWLARLIGHLVVATDQYGDAIDVRRRQQPRTTSAELVWMLLPPLTAGIDGFVLAGMLEPTYEVGGDAFDYALSETTVELAIFDAMGHGLNAGLLTAATLAAYRNARREGHDLQGQAGAIDTTITTNWGETAFVTGIVCELDLTTGRLRYVNAGHPRPLVLRSGKVVKTLAGGHRTPLGVVAGGVDTAEEFLEPGDWLVLHSDGVTEARDPAGRFFGGARLVEMLEREVASGQPPPETVRRVTRAVLDYQGGVLQDDATILLARWDGSPMTRRVPRASEG